MGKSNKLTQEKDLLNPLYYLKLSNCQRKLWNLSTESEAHYVKNMDEFNFYCRMYF